MRVYYTVNDLEHEKWRQINQYNAIVEKAQALLDAIDTAHKGRKLSKTTLLALNDPCAELKRALEPFRE